METPKAQVGVPMSEEDLALLESAPMEVERPDEVQPKVAEPEPVSGQAADRIYLEVTLGVVDNPADSEAEWCYRQRLVAQVKAITEAGGQLETPKEFR